MRALRGAVIVALLLVAGLLAARGAEWYRTLDFFCFYHGARSLVLQQDPYDEAWWQTATAGVFPHPTFRQGATGTTACVGRYGYPLWSAVAILPLGALPLEPSATLWAAIGIGATIFGMTAAWRAVGGSRELALFYAVLVVASQPFWLLLITGQMSGLETGLAGGLALALSRGRQASAGVALAALALKPQIVGITIPAVGLRAILGGERRLLTAFVATGLVMLVVPMAFLLRWPLEWLGELGTRRLRVTALLPSAWGVAGDLLGNVALGALLCVGLVLLVWLTVRRSRLDGLDVLVLSLPLSLFVTPYAWSYDYLVLAVPWAYLLARAPERGAPRIVVLIGIIALATLIPWALYAIGFARGTETLSAFVPAATAVFVALAIRDRRSA